MTANNFPAHNLQILMPVMIANPQHVRKVILQRLNRGLQLGPEIDNQRAHALGDLKMQFAQISNLWLYEKGPNSLLQLLALV
jgi:hypothetical protein